MNDRVWRIDMKAKSLVPAYDLDPAATPILAAKPFSVSLKSVMVANDLDGFPRGANDLLLTTTAALGDNPRVRRVHDYQEEIKAGAVLKDFYADTMFVCDDYPATGKLWLEVNVVEVDVDSDDVKAMTNAFISLAGLVGAIFPVTLPYVGVAAGLATAIGKLMTSLKKNSSPLRCPVSLFPSHRPDAGIPLQPGIFAVFSRDVDPSAYQYQQGFTLKRTGKKKDDEPAYAMFHIEPCATIDAKYVLSQKVATLLTQLDQGNANATVGTIDFLKDTLQQYSNFNDLKRYAELKAKKPEDLTTDEKALMDKIAKKEDLKPFIS